MNKTKRREYGAHLTEIEIFKDYILPHIKNKLYDYLWVDLYAGEGNLILPILELIPEKERIDFFKNHIFMFDIQKKMINNAIDKAKTYGIPKSIARKNIKVRNTIENYPNNILNNNLPVYHITNPPYLYLGYISKHKETQKYLKYFEGDNDGYQDLYQICLINDLRNGIEDMIYIIPSNFLFGYSVSNRIRDDLLNYYYIDKGVIFEREIFEYTGTNVIICFLRRKPEPKTEPIIFEGIKINNKKQTKTYKLKPENHYRAGVEFEEFVTKYSSAQPVTVDYYFTMNQMEDNKGKYKLDVIDANCYKGNEYEKKTIKVNKSLQNKVKSNLLFIRTIDTGSNDGRAGLYLVKGIFAVDGILVTGNTYRTHPIQIFLEPKLSSDEQYLLKDYFNAILEYFREKTDSEFLTTYKYSNSIYTRKYLGLSQARKIIKTFPHLKITNNKETKNKIKSLINKQNISKLIDYVKTINSS